MVWELDGPMPTLKMSKTLRDIGETPRAGDASSPYMWPIIGQHQGTNLSDNDISDPCDDARSLSPAQAPQFPSLMLIGPLLRARRQRAGKTHVLRVLLAAGTAVVRFPIAHHRLPSRPPALGNGRNVALEVHGAAVEAHPIPWPQAVRGAHARAIDVHLAAAYRLGGERSGLEEAHGEKPAVDARAGCGVLAAHGCGARAGGSHGRWVIRRHAARP